MEIMIYLKRGSNYVDSMSKPVGTGTICKPLL